MSVRKLSDNKWFIDYYPAGGKGKRVQIVFHGAESDARAFELEARRNNAGLRNSINPKIADVIPEYLEWLKLHRAKTTYNDVKRALKFLVPHFGHLQVPRITQTIINQYKLKRQKTPRAANKELSYLKGIINFMVKNNYANPLPFKIEELPYQSPLPQIPHPDEFQKFLAQICDPLKKAMILLMWTSGFRWKEVSNLKWENIDFQGNIIYLVDTKGSRPRVGVLSGEVKALLEPFRKEGGYVFINPKTGRPYKGLYTLFRLACKRAGIRKLKPHLLRHAFGTYTLEASGDLRAVQEMLGHKDINTTTIYTQIATNRMRAIMTKTANYISDMRAQQIGENRGDISASK